MKFPRLSRPFIYMPVVVLLIAAISSACVLSNPTPAVWALTPTALAYEASATAFAATEAASFKPQFSFTATPSYAPPTPTTPAQGLNKSGPWLVYPTDGGEALDVLNSDGNGNLHIAIPTLLDANDLKSGLSPKGGMLAFRTGIASKPEDTALYLLSLPDGKLEKVTSLVTDSVVTSASATKDVRAINALAGVIQSGTLAWSPDGRYLAFIAVLERPNADLYLYDTVTKKIGRMNFGSNSMATPFWSQDSQWIAAQEVVSFTGSGGWSLGSMVRFNAQSDLYQEIDTPPAKSTREVFVGWASRDAFLIYSQNSSSDFSLRLINLTYLKITTLFAGNFHELAYDSSSKTLAFTIVNSGVASGAYQTGLYMMTPNDTQPQQVQAGTLSNLQWSVEGNEFLATGAQGVLGITTDGQSTLLAQEDQALISPNGKWLACWGDAASTFNPGIWLYRSAGSVSQQITNQTVQQVVWQPDSNGIFFLSGNNLFLSSLPSLNLIELDSNVQPGTGPMLLWVNSAH